MGDRHLSEVDLVQYADGAAAPSQVRRIEEHLRVCAACAEAVAGVRAAAAAVRQVPTVAVPEDLRQRVAAAMAAESARSLTCREAGPLIHLHLDQELAPAGVVALRHHLTDCLRCQAEWVTLSAMARLVRSLRVFSAPSAVREVVWAALRSRPAPVAWAVRLRPALAVAVLATAALFVFAPPGQRPERETRRVIATAPAELGEPGDADQSGAAQGEDVAMAEMSEATAGEVVGPGGGPLQSARAGQSHKVERPVGVASAAPKRQWLTDSATGAGALHVGKGPAPEPEGTVAVRVASRVPSAVLTLREIAMAHAAITHGQRALDTAGETFATLDSESTLARLPESPAVGPSAGPGSSTVPPGEGESGRGGAEPEREIGRDRADSSLPRYPVV